MVRSGSLGNRKVSTAKGKMAKAARGVATGRKTTVAGAGKGARKAAGGRRAMEGAETRRTPKEPTNNRGQERTVVIFRNPADPSAAREERRIAQKEWTKGNKALKKEGWYRDDEPPTAQDIDPNTQITLLRNNPDDPSAPRDQRVISHGDWVENMEQYQAEGWFRESELHSASKPTDTVLPNAHNTRTE